MHSRYKIELMYGGRKKEDSLRVLQSDITKLTAYSKNQNTSKSYSKSLLCRNCKLPSIYAKKKIKQDTEKIKQEHQLLAKKFQQFETRILNLQNTRAQNNRISQPVPYFFQSGAWPGLPFPTYIPIQYTYLTDQPSNHIHISSPIIPYNKANADPASSSNISNNNNNRNRISRRRQSSIQSNNSNLGIQLVKQERNPRYQKMGALALFRIAGLVVLFAVVFPRYARSFTINRFDLFKKMWLQGNIKHEKQKLAQYFRKNIGSKIIFSGQLKEVSWKETSSQMQYSDRSYEQQQDKKQQTSKQDSVEQQDNSSQSYLSSSCSETTQQKKSQQTQLQLHLKIQSSIEFVVNFIKSICNTINRNDFIETHPYLQLLLPGEFQTNYMYDESDSKYLHLHPEFGYSQHTKNFTEYLLVKEIFLNLFVEQGMLIDLGQTMSRKVPTSKPNVQVTYFVRTVILRSMIQDYLNGKLSWIKQFPLPTDLLVPRFNRSKHFFCFQKNDIYLIAEDIEELFESENKKWKKQVFSCLNNMNSMLMRRLIAYRKKYIYDQLKIFSSYRFVNSQYFHIHNKTTKTVSKKSIKKLTTTNTETGSSENMAYKLTKSFPLRSHISIADTLKQQQHTQKSRNPQNSTKSFKYTSGENTISNKIL